jgi:aquaporin Z
MAKDSQKYFAEFAGTLILVFVGCGVAVVSVGQYLPTALAFGLAVLAMVYTIGPISGCHINPAVSVAMLLVGKIKAKDCLMYIVAQFLGAIVGAALLMVVAGGIDSYSLEQNGLGQNGYGDGYSGYALGAAFLAEVMLTAVFVFVILGATSKAAPKGSAGIAIGLALTFVHLVGIPITGTSVNPARSFGPAVMVRGDALSQWWLFLVGPIIGAALAAILWRLFLESATSGDTPPA